VMGMTGPVAVGNPAFAVNLAGADPLATIGFLVLSPPTVPAVVCGDCAVIASGSFAAPVVGGFSSVALPLPCDIGLVGVQVDAQWIVLPTTAIPCPALGGVSASNRWRFTIGQ